MYNKLFTRILDSSIWLTDAHIRIVWVTLLAAMDEDGFAHFAAIGNLANRSRVTTEQAGEAVTLLESPDENSSDQTNEGRRIERVPGGWMVLNSSKYRQLGSREVSKEQTRNRVREFRKRKKEHTEPEAYTYTGANAPVTLCNANFDELWSCWPRHDGSKASCKEKFYRYMQATPCPPIIERAQLQVSIWQKEGREKQFIPMLQTWLNQKRFETEPELIERAGGNGNGTYQGKRTAFDVLRELYPDDRKLAASAGKG